jgi:hypothetical protein
VSVVLEAMEFCPGREREGKGGSGERDSIEGEGWRREQL